jgi:hypothetical protein
MVKNIKERILYRLENPIVSYENIVLTFISSYLIFFIIQNVNEHNKNISTKNGKIIEINIINGSLNLSPHLNLLEVFLKRNKLSFNNAKEAKKTIQTLKENKIIYTAPNSSFPNDETYFLDTGRLNNLQTNKSN